MKKAYWLFADVANGAINNTRGSVVPVTTLLGNPRGFADFLVSNCHFFTLGYILTPYFAQNPTLAQHNLPPPGIVGVETERGLPWDGNRKIEPRIIYK